VVEEESPVSAARLRAFFPDSASSTALVTSVREYAAGLSTLGFLTAPGDVDIAPLLEEAWASAWQQSFPPRAVGRRLWVKPPWEAADATDRIPIVFIGGGDPVELGLVKSLARPGGNLTGIASLDVELAPKRLEIFRELVPRLKRVLLVYDATNVYAVAHLEAYRAAARRLDLTLVERPVRNQDEAGAAISGLRRGDVDGILSPRFLSLNIPGFILDIAPKGTFPTMFQGTFFVERGGLVSYVASDGDLGRLAARLVDRILKGAKPADLPVEQPTKFELVINVKTAKALGLTIPQSLLQRADRLIQ